MTLTINRLTRDDILERCEALLARTPFTSHQLRVRAQQNLLTVDESAVLRGLENLEFLDAIE